MHHDLAADAAAAIAICLGSHIRIESTAGSIDDDEAPSPSRLPGWTIAMAPGRIRGAHDARRLLGWLSWRSGPAPVELAPWQ